MGFVVLDLHLDRKNLTVIRKKRAIRISPTENCALARLIAQFPEGVPVSELMEAIWGHRKDGGPTAYKQSFSSLMHCLRLKLRAIGLSIVRSPTRPSTYRIIEL